MNKKLAIARLSKLLKNINSQNMKNKKNELWDQHNELERGNPVKIYYGMDLLLKE